MNRFLWAKFQLMDIREALTKSVLRTILENLPESLSDTYLRIIRRTSQSIGGQAKLDMMRKIFCWVAVARRPLHIHELEEAVALESSDTYLHTDRLPKDSGAKLVSDCNNLVVLDENDDTVVFAHHTVEQFLFSTQECATELSELMDLTSCDSEVGDICLAYLNFPDFETQVAEVPTEIYVEAPLAEEIVWSSVLFVYVGEAVYGITGVCQEVGSVDVDAVEVEAGLVRAVWQDMLLELVVTKLGHGRGIACAELAG